MADDRWVAQAVLNEIESPLEFLAYSVSRKVKEVTRPTYILADADKQRIVDAVCEEVRMRLQEAFPHTLSF